jgi:hypothetical protein
VRRGRVAGGLLALFFLLALQGAQQADCGGVAGKNGATNRLWPSSSLNTCKGVIVTITDRMAAWRRERRVLQRVSRAAWRLEQAERERAWALASAC